MKAKLTIRLKKRCGDNPFYDEGFAKAIEALKEAVKMAFIRDITRVLKLFKYLKNGQNFPEIGGGDFIVCR